MKEESLCDEQVFNRLYKESGTQIRNFLYYKCGDLGQAEDLMQESFLKIWKKCAEVILDKAEALIYTIANRLLIDQARTEKVAFNFQKQLRVTENKEDPYYELRTAEFRNEIEQEIASLPEGQRTAFLMNRIDQMTYKEIALRLEISETAVEKRISKALAKLRDKIEVLKKI